jgi:hypothetical protein
MSMCFNSSDEFTVSIYGSKYSGTFLEKKIARGTEVINTKDSLNTKGVEITTRHFDGSTYTNFTKNEQTFEYSLPSYNESSDLWRKIYLKGMKENKSYVWMDGVWKFISASKVVAWHNIEKMIISMGLDLEEESFGYEYVPKEIHSYKIDEFNPKTKTKIDYEKKSRRVLRKYFEYISEIDPKFDVRSYSYNQYIDGVCWGPEHEDFASTHTPWEVSVNGGEGIFADNPYNRDNFVSYNITNADKVIAGTKSQISKTGDQPDSEYVSNFKKLSRGEADASKELLLFESTIVNKTRLKEEDDELFANYTAYNWTKNHQDYNYGTPVNMQKKYLADDEREIIAKFFYDQKNRLIREEFPNGNEVEYEYIERGENKDLLSKKIIKVANNINNKTQYFVSEVEDYDITGKALSSSSYMLDSNRNLYQGKKGENFKYPYPKVSSQAEYDTLGRKIASYINGIQLNKIEIDEANRTLTSTSKYGSITKAYFDHMYRQVMSEAYRPKGTAYENLDNTIANSVLISKSETYDFHPIFKKPQKSKRYLDPAGTDYIESRTEFDALGRAIKSYMNNTRHPGEKLLSEVVYKEDENEVWSKGYKSGPLDIYTANGGPSYKLSFDGTNVEEIVGLTPQLGDVSSYTTTIVPYEAGQCAQFDGTQTLEYPDRSDVNTQDGTRKSISMWVEFANLTGRKTLHEQGGGTNWWHIYTDGTKLYNNVGEGGSTNGTLVSTLDLQANTPYHIVVEIDAENDLLTMYINGQGQGTAPAGVGSTLAAHSGDWAIAYNENAKDHNSGTVTPAGFVGKMAQYLYWAEKDRLLTQKEIDNLYNGIPGEWKLGRKNPDWLGRSFKSVSYTDWYTDATLDLTTATPATLDALENTIVSTIDEIDLTGKALKVTHPSGEQFETVYDNLGRVEKVIRPDGSFTLMNYDLNGNVIATRDRKGVETFTTYDSANSASKVFVKSIPSISVDHEYCHLGEIKVTKYEDDVAEITTTNVFNRFGQVKLSEQEIDGMKRFVSTTYNPEGKQLDTTVCGFSGWTKSFTNGHRYFGATGEDTTNRVRSAMYEGIVDPATTTDTPLFINETSFDGVMELHYQFGGTTTLHNDSDNGFMQLSKIEHPDAESTIEFTSRDWLGQIEQKKQGTDPLDDYVYDSLGRIDEAEGFKYAFDEISNITSVTDIATVQAVKEFTYSEENPMQLANYTKKDTDGNELINWDFYYDEVGNTVEITGRFDRMVYDGSNNLREIQFYPDDMGRVRKDKYWYNLSGHRYKKEEYIGLTTNTEKTYYLYSGNDILMEEKFIGDKPVSAKFNVGRSAQYNVKFDKE